MNIHETTADSFSFDQPCISTSEIQRCMKHINTWWKDAKRTLGPLGIMYGDAGTGKTMAIQNGLLKNESEQPGRCILIKGSPAPTQRSILSAIGNQIGLSLHRCSSYVMIAKIQEVFQKERSPLLVFDDADSFLDREGRILSSFPQLFGMLLGDTSCRLLFVGTPQLLAGLEMVPKLNARLGLLHHFGPLSDAELYEAFLPQLVFPGWVFHSTDPRDIQIGKCLWENTQPSLRHVCTVLDHASSLAHIHGSKQITFEEISLALKDFWKGRQAHEKGRNQ